MDNKKLIVFLDSGDTLIDESSEIRNDEGIVIRAKLVDGADMMIKALHSKGFKLVLVADGQAQSFKNMFTQNGLYDYFSAMICSENIKVFKPDIRMFKAAAGALNLGENDFKQIVMVGNNLARDIKGANLAGITSIFLNWSPRYTKIPADQSEVPAHTISHLSELPDLIEKLNGDLVDERLDIVKKYSPSIYFDEKEPFFPIYVGYSVFDKASKSFSFPRQIHFNLPDLRYVIEYAIYWDFDIQHLYELEHVWVYVDLNGKIIDCDASWHGDFYSELKKDRSNIENETHVKLYSQPGKHAFASEKERFGSKEDNCRATFDRAGKDGLIVTDVGKGMYKTNQEINRIVQKYLETYRFKPMMQFIKYEWPESVFIPWEELKNKIPDLIRKQLSEMCVFMTSIGNE